MESISKQMLGRFVRGGFWCTADSSSSSSSCSKAGPVQRAHLREQSLGAAAGRIVHAEEVEGPHDKCVAAARVIVVRQRRAVAELAALGGKDGGWAVATTTLVGQIWPEVG